MQARVCVLQLLPIRPLLPPRLCLLRCRCCPCTSEMGLPQHATLDLALPHPAPAAAASAWALSRKHSLGFCDAGELSLLRHVPQCAVNVLLTPLRCILHSIHSCRPHMFAALDVQAILVDADSGRLHGVSDPRKDGAPAAA